MCAENFPVFRQRIEVSVVLGFSGHTHRIASYHRYMCAESGFLVIVLTLRPEISLFHVPRARNVT